MGGSKKKEVSPLSIEEKEMIAGFRTQASANHEKYREGRRIQNPDGTETIKSRFKPLHAEQDGMWMKKHPERVGKDPDFGDEAVPAVDIASYSFDELPPSRQEDSLASYDYAIESVYRAARNGTPLNETFIDATANAIHEQWFLRNGEDLKREISIRMKQGGFANEEAARADARLTDLIDQLDPYEKLTDENKERDRKFVREIVKLYEEKHPPS